MKEQNEREKEKKKVRMSSEKRFYLWTAIGCALAMVAIIVVAVAVSGGTGVQQQGGVNSSPNSSVTAPPDSSSTPSGGNQGGNENSGGGNQTVVKPEGMVMPVESAAVLNEYGFYHNQTLNTYYEHEGVDFAAEAGSSVFCVDDGVVESIYKDDLLLGTEIVVDHGEGLKSVYRFVTEAENLQVGASVEKGQMIATVAEANGNEYKDGAHLHFEMRKDNVCVDPAVYLTLEEK